MNPKIQDDWDIILRLLPAGWEEKALELGALSRRRKIDSAKTLLRVLMIHLATGISLRSTAEYAHETGLCSINAPMPHCFIDSKYPKNGYIGCACRF